MSLQLMQAWVKSYLISRSHEKYSLAIQSTSVTLSLKLAVHNSSAQIQHVFDPSTEELNI